jgi:argininosuccinate synthase
MADRIVLAYSGGLDTSVAIPWLAERYNAEIIAVTLDLGQGRELDEVRERALASGAARCHVLDAREEFARDYILPALKANALYEERYPLATALGRPLIAKKLIEIAHIEDAKTIAHGCTGTGTRNDRVRIEFSAQAIDPSIAIVAPARLWGLTPAERFAYAQSRGIPVPATVENAYRIDTNLWGRSIEDGVLDDVWHEPPEDIYTLTKAAADGPNQPAYVEVGFESGVPVTVNGVSMSFTELIDSLTTIAGAHGVGRLDIIENRLMDTKSREVYEVPAAFVLHVAHKELEGFVTSTATNRFKHFVAVQYADIVYSGAWFTPLREALDAFVEKIQERVTGTIRLKLFKGGCHVVGRRSPFALYDRALTTDDDTGDALDRAAADNALRKG